MLFPTFFNLSLNLAIKSSWSEPQSAPSLVFVDCIELLHFGCKEYNQSDFSVGHLVMTICRVFSCVVGRAIYCHPVYLTYMQSISWETLGWKKHKLESRLPGEISINWYADDTILMAESEEELKSFLMKVKEESEKVALKLNTQKTKIIGSGPNTLWQIDGETVETVADFIFGGSKITADGDCSHEIKRCLLLGRKVMTTLDSILKSRDITLSAKVHVKAVVFPVVMYGCERWTIKKTERWRIDAFELWCWRRLLKVPWTARRSNQSILKEISPACSL